MLPAWIDRQGLAFSSVLFLETLKSRKTNLECLRHAVVILPQREQADTTKGEEEPDNTDSDPAGEKRLAEDIAAAVERHWPED
jgi:hypothetical protein